MRFGEKTSIVSGIAYIAIGSLLILINLGWYVPIANILEKNIRNEEQNAAEKSEIAASTFLNLRRSNLEVIARALSDDLSNITNHDLVVGLLREKSFNRVFLSDDDGSELFIADRARTVLPEEYGTLRGQDEFTRALSGEVAFGRVRITDRFEPVLTITVPIISSAGKTIGVLGAELSAKSVFEVISAITIQGRGNAYVVDDTGVLIAHKDVSLVLKNTNLANRLVVQETLQNGANGNMSDEVYVYENENDVLVRAAGAYQKDARWAVIFEDSKNEAEQPIFIIHILLGVIVGIGLLTFFILRKININLTRTKTILERERNQFSTILVSMSEGLFVTDKDGVIIISNKSAERLIGMEAGAIVGTGIYDTLSLFKDGALISKNERPITTVIKTGDPINLTLSDAISFHKKDGTDVPITMSVTAFREGGRKSDAISGTIITFRDATNERKAQAELMRRTEETEKLNSFMIGRELKMIELKDKIAALEKK